MCNHVKSSPTPVSGEEKACETVQTGDGRYQDNLGFRASNDGQLGPEPDYGDTEYDHDHGCDADQEPGDSYHERTSGSYTDSYEGEGGYSSGRQIPYRLMREMSPPPQPTHRAPGLPPGYRQYSRTILVETRDQPLLTRRPSYVSSICVQPVTRDRAASHGGRSTHWSSEQELRQRERE